VAFGQHVQARRQQLHRLGENGQLPLLRLAREAPHADDVAALHQVVHFPERVLAAFVGADVGHDLDLHALAVDVVKHQFALATLAVHAPRDCPRRHK
jgi:hypothetical protein